MQIQSLVGKIRSSIPLVQFANLRKYRESTKEKVALRYCNKIVDINKVVGAVFFHTNTTVVQVTISYGPRMN